jgi:hypothetical protein
MLKDFSSRGKVIKELPYAIQSLEGRSNSSTFDNESGTPIGSLALPRHFLSSFIIIQQIALELISAEIRVERQS